MSVPSAKSSVMSAIAYLAAERSTRFCGMPSSSSSIGVTMRVSTSSGVMPGALMMIFTCVDETSGKASIGSSRNAATPAPISSSVARIVRMRWVSANSTRRANIAA